MVNWKQKLSSRKFWALVASFVTSLAVLIGVDTGTTEKIVALVTATGSLIAYMLAEAYVDAHRKNEGAGE